MWNYITENLNGGNILKYKILSETKVMSRIEVIENWINNQSFRSFYTSILKDNEFEAYFWENPSITKSQLNEDYEFVLVNSNSLINIKSTPNVFRDYYEEGEMIVIFPNLGKDAMLVVPTPNSDDANYAHLSKFIRNAPAAQLDELWWKLGKSYKKMIGENKLWLSTAGLGVSWLHLRIDSRPKYYRYAAYKK